MRFTCRILPLLLLTGTPALLVCPVPALAQTAQAPVQLKEYGIAFATPTGYLRPVAKDVPAAASGADYLALGPVTNNFSSNINIITDEAPFSTLPSNFGTVITGQLKEQMAAATESFTLLSQKKIMLAGVEAFEMSEELRLKGAANTIRNRQVFFVKNGRLFTITFTAEVSAFAKDAPVFDTFLKSVRWIPVVKAKEPPAEEAKPAIQ